MMSKLPVFYRLLMVLLVCMLAASCEQPPPPPELPSVPAFEELGFEDALDAVRRQMLNSYERWQQEPENAERNGYYGMLLSAYAKYATSEAFFRRAQLLDPAEFRWTYYLAISVQQQGRYQEAATLFREALSIDPDSVETRMRLASVLYESNDTDQSVTLYKELTRELPERIDAWLGLGKALDRQGKHSAAIRALRRAKDLGSQIGDVRYALASALSANGEKDDAEREFAAYEKRRNNKIGTSDRFIKAVVRLNASDGPFLAKADYQIARGQFREAAGFFRRALEINPMNQDAWGGLVFSLGKLGDKEATRQSYQAALADGIHYKRLHFAYAEALRSWDDIDGARDVLGKAIELDPRYTEALLEMADLDLESGNAENAVTHYERAVAVVPNDRVIRFSLAQALNAAQRFDQAVVQLEPLVDDPEQKTAQVLLELALAYRGTGRTADAADALQRGKEAAQRAYDTITEERIDELLTN